eukprot:11193050-Lingulodinium_polyedra.AAC.1
MAEHSVQSSSAESQFGACSHGSMSRHTAEQSARRHRLDAPSAQTSRQHEHSIDCNLALPDTAPEDEQD